MAKKKNRKSPQAVPAPKGGAKNSQTAPSENKESLEAAAVRQKEENSGAEPAKKGLSLEKASAAAEEKAVTAGVSAASADKEQSSDGKAGAAGEKAEAAAEGVPSAAEKAEAAGEKTPSAAEGRAETANDKAVTAGKKAQASKKEAGSYKDKAPSAEDAKNSIREVVPNRQAQPSGTGSGTNAAAIAAAVIVVLGVFLVWTQIISPNLGGPNKNGVAAAFGIGMKDVFGTSLFLKGDVLADNGELNESAVGRRPEDGKKDPKDGKQTAAGKERAAKDASDKAAGLPEFGSGPEGVEPGSGPKGVKPGSGPEDMKAGTGPEGVKPGSGSDKAKPDGSEPNQMAAEEANAPEEKKFTDEQLCAAAPPVFHVAQDKDARRLVMIDQYLYVRTYLDAVKAPGVSEIDKLDEAAAACASKNDAAGESAAVAKAHAAAAKALKNYFAPKLAASKVSGKDKFVRQAEAFMAEGNLGDAAMAYENACGIVNPVRAEEQEHRN